MRGIHTCNVEYRLKRKGCYHWINASIQLLKKDSSADIFARVFLKDIQAQKEKEEKLQKEVHIDALTGASIMTMIKPHFKWQFLIYPSIMIMTYPMSHLHISLSS